MKLFMIIESMYWYLSVLREKYFSTIYEGYIKPFAFSSMYLFNEFIVSSVGLDKTV